MEKCTLQKMVYYGGDYYKHCYNVEFKNSEGRNRKGYTYMYTTISLKSYKPGQVVYMSYDKTKKRGIRIIYNICDKEEWEEHLKEIEAEK